MKADDLEAKMRAGECYHSLRVPPGAFIVIRVDGRLFSRLTERLVEKPFDRTFHEWMIKAAEGLLTTLQAVYAYTESDEISVLLPRETSCSTERSRSSSPSAPLEPVRLSRCIVGKRSNSIPASGWEPKLKTWSTTFDGDKWTRPGAL